MAAVPGRWPRGGGGRGSPPPLDGTARSWKVDARATPAGDPAETRAIQRAFGEQAFRIPVSATKSMTGHQLGGAGALETAICVQVMQTGMIPPTINLKQPDPECDLDYVPNQARPADVEIVLSNSFGFGGHNVALLFGKLGQV